MTNLRRLPVLFCILVILVHASFSQQGVTNVLADDETEGDSPITTEKDIELGRQPTADDSHFVKDSGDDLDRYIYRSDRSDGRLKFNIPITRYFFNEKDAQVNIQFDSQGFLTSTSLSHIKDKKILPATVKLIMRIFDVDEDNRNCPEVDLVFVNDKLLEKNGRQVFLSGANNYWSLVSFDVPIELLKFPQKKGSTEPGSLALQPAYNEIAIEIDSICKNRWAVEVDYGTLEITGTVRPVVFAHGWNEDVNTFNTYEDQLTSDGIPSAGSADLKHGFEPIPASAHLLEDYIFNAVKEYGVDRINLVAHSKGGLVSRMALVDTKVAIKVENLVTFDTPNHGTKWAEVSSGLETLCNLEYKKGSQKSKACAMAGKEFTPTNVRNNFNYSGCVENWLWGTWSNCKVKYVQQPNVNYWAFSVSKKMFGFVDVINPKQYAGYPWKSNSIPYPSELNVDGEFSSDHNSILENLDAYHCSIHLMDNSRYDCPQKNVNTVEQATNQTITANQIISTQTGETVGAGQSNLMVSVDNSNQFMLEVYSDANLNVVLTEPGGRKIDPALASTDPLTMYEESQNFGLNYYVYVINTPSAGMWGVQVQSSDTAHFMVVGSTDSPVELKVATTKSSYLPGEIITGQAALIENGNMILGGLFTGEFEQSDGTYFPVNFYDDGTNGDITASDGIYTTQFSAPIAQANLYLKVAVSHNETQREVSTLISVSSQTAVIGSVTNEWTEDDDEDGLYDRLMLQIDLNVLQSGYFDLQGDLVNSNGEFIQSAQYLSRSENPAPVLVGNHSIILEFDGKTFWDSGKDGPYTLTNLYVNDSTNQIFQVDSASNIFTTAAYTRNQFEHPQIIFESISENVTDINNNGLYDVLTFHLQFKADTTENYTINSRLMDINNNEIGWSSTNFNTSSNGSYTADLSFLGSDINRNQVDGPYSLSDVSIYGQGGTTEIYFSSLGTTTPYKYIQFEIDTSFGPKPIGIVRSNPITPTGAASVDFTVTFSESVMGVDTNDFALTQTGTLTGAFVTNVSGGPGVYTVTVNTGTGSGELRLDLPVGATITNLTGIPLAGLPYTSGESYTIDKTAPSMISLRRSDPDISGEVNLDLVLSVAGIEPGVSGADVFVSYDPAFVAPPSAPGVRTAEALPDFFGSTNVSINELLPAAQCPGGVSPCIHLVLAGSPQSTQTGIAARYHFRGVAEGTACFAVLQSTLVNADGYPVQHAGVPQECVPVELSATASGVVNRQGIVAAAGASSTGAGPVCSSVTAIANETFGPTHTDSGGGYSFINLPVGTYLFRAVYPGYLTSEKNGVNVSTNVPAVDAGATTLRGGDVNGDNAVNILDVATILSKFGLSGVAVRSASADCSGPDEAVDINDDGLINVSDLAIAAGNWGKVGPTAWQP